MAELVDARVSEARDGDIVEVQVLSSAPYTRLILNLVRTTCKLNLNPKFAIMFAAIMKSDFYRAIEKHQSAFDIRLDEVTIRALENFYFGVMKNNEHLHLVGKCDAEEFAVRHILESLYALRFLPENSFFADIGAGAGLPGIPCLIVRPDLKAVLIESGM